MAEISYPFSGDSAGGGSKLVSQTQWQPMAHLWAPDSIDFAMTSATYTATQLPLNVTLSGSNLVVSPGSAWVGGFYYKLDASLTIAAPINAGANPRIDLLVLRLDPTAGSVNVAISTGQASATPTEPTPQRLPGGIWEMPLSAIILPANNGTRTLSPRKYFPSPGVVQVPWNRAEASNSLPPGAFTIDMDVNNTDVIKEGFRAPSGDMITRTLGKRLSYTPDLFTVFVNIPSGDRQGYWRYIAPGTVEFSVRLSNRSINPITKTAGWFIGFTLPVTPSKFVPTVFSGVLSNPESRNGKPNLMSITAQTRMESSNVCALYSPSTSSVSGGLDGLDLIPGMSELCVSGVYATNDLEERSISSV